MTILKPHSHAQRNGFSPVHTDNKYSRSKSGRFLPKLQLFYNEVLPLCFTRQRFCADLQWRDGNTKWEFSTLNSFSWSSVRDLSQNKQSEFCPSSCSLGSDLLRARINRMAAINTSSDVNMDKLVLWQDWFVKCKPVHHMLNISHGLIWVQGQFGTLWGCAWGLAGLASASGTPRCPLCLDMLWRAQLMSPATSLLCFHQ